MKIAVVDPKTGQVVAELDDSEYSCRGSGSGEVGAMCGGCWRCLEMQATHGGYELRPVAPEPLAIFVAGPLQGQCDICGISIRPDDLYHRQWVYDRWMQACRRCCKNRTDDQLMRMFVAESQR